MIQRQKMAMLLLYRVLQFVFATLAKILIWKSKFAPTEGMVM